MAKGISSMLLNAANNIVSTNRSTSQMKRSQTTYQDFVRFMQLETNNLKAIKFNQRKLKKALGANVAVSFGSAGNLLSGLASGALDAASFVGDFFGKKDGKSKLPKPNSKAGRPLQSGTKIKIPGVRALGVLTPLLAGLDFAQGISQGESTGKAAAGAAGSAAGGIAGAAAGGALAGAITSGMIGQGLVPIPGLGFVLGAAVVGLGAFAGGYFADRAYEATEKNAKQKIESKLKIQEAKQKEAAAAAAKLSLPEVLDKFERVVFQFERVSYNLQLSEVTDTPTGYDEELDPEELPPPTDESTGGPVQYGSGNAEFGETGNVRNSTGWVHGHFQGETVSEVVNDTTTVVKALLKQGSPVYLNPGIDLLPSKQYSDSELRNYVDAARRSHTHSGSGKSIDVFVRKGTKVPVPLSNIGPTGKDFGGYGRGGLGGYIQGTRTWIGHLAPNSKPGLAQTKGEIKPKGKESGEMQDLVPNPNMMNKTSTDQTTIQRQSQVMSQRFIKPSTQSSSNNLIQAQTNVFPQEKLTQMKYDENNISKVQDSMIQPTSTQLVVIPQQIQQYPSYNMPQSSVTLIPILSGNGNQKPVVISTPNGGSQTVVVSGPSEGQVLNSLYKNILLTSLSAT